MITEKTVTYVDLSKARIGERFEFKGQTYKVVDIDEYENAGGQPRVAIVLETYCHVCGAAFELTTNRRPKWLKKGCGRDHATTPWTRRQPADTPTPVHAQPTRQNATSSPCEAIQATSGPPSDSDELPTVRYSLKNRVDGQ